MTLCFAIPHLTQEIEQAATACRGFVVDDYPIHAFKQQIERLRYGKDGAKAILEIPREAPIKTRPSHGKYRPNGGGGLNLVGTVSCKWQVTLRKTPQIDAIVVDDLASTTISLLDCPTAATHATWNFDVGSADSPGCHFHMQMPWPSAGAMASWPEKPSEIDVPRLPIPYILPTDALEFLLGELFQAEWPKHRAKHKNHLQGQRVSKMFEWHARQIAANPASPWLGLKMAKPLGPDFLFADLT